MAWPSWCGLGCRSRSELLMVKDASFPILTYLLALSLTKRELRTKLNISVNHFAVPTRCRKRNMRVTYGHSCTQPTEPHSNLGLEGPQSHRAAGRADGPQPGAACRPDGRRIHLSSSGFRVDAPQSTTARHSQLAAWRQRSTTASVLTSRGRRASCPAETAKFTPRSSEPVLVAEHGSARQPRPWSNANQGLTSD